jgi:hypothetical protein
LRYFLVNMFCQRCLESVGRNVEWIQISRIMCSVSECFLQLWQYWGGRSVEFE